MRVTPFGISLHLACLCLTSAAPLSWKWASIESSELRLLRLHPASLEDCLDACWNNDDCESVEYDRLANLCDLHPIFVPFIYEQSSRGSIIVHRSDIKERALDLPHVRKSLLTHTKACDMSELFGNRLLGNMNRVGDRIVVGVSPKCCFASYTCIDDGKWNETNCRDKPRDCEDFGESLESGIYTIFPNCRRVEVFCDFDDQGGPWTVIQRRVDNTVDFYRSYTSYVKGFGYLNGNFWLGLDAISTITLLNNRQYKLKVIIKDSIEGTRVAEYSMFKVMGAYLGYKLNIGGYSGNAGDALEIHNGQKFSTYDMDRDNIWFINCAETLTGAWWFNACYHSNLNGVYGDNSVGKGITWRQTTGWNRSAIFATMKLKARHDYNGSMMFAEFEW